MDDIEGDKEVEDNGEDFELTEENSHPQISIQAMHGSVGFQTMRVTGHVGKRQIHILIDSGSTHNFLDENFAKKCGCKLEAMKVQSVTIAGGDKLLCHYMCKSFKWTLHSTEFQSEVYLLPLGSCDLVLGVQWLSTLGTIKWDFKQLKMEFFYGDKIHILRGIKGNRIQLMPQEGLPKALQNAGQIFMLQQLPQGITPPLETVTATLPAVSEAIETILTQFDDVFQDFNGLPPSRGQFDHRIPLKEGTSPINIRPYRYPLKHKDIIENLVTEMLEKGIIQFSASPFASPVVLVGKKDGTWRLSVDYRELNKQTVKDKFPIPIIEELLDELAGAMVFTKIDLRSGYHQVRMNSDDVAKTAFKTHSGHYEFLVMPFGLTNAPATFQSLMNFVFRDYLRKFVLVFFDDILIYCSSMALHLKHVKIVLQTMRHNHLIAKRSKCAFGIPKIEYLGHYISGAGVETDPRKIEAITAWPTPQCQRDI